MGGRVTRKKRGEERRERGARALPYLSLASPVVFPRQFSTALYNLNAWNKFLMTLPYFLEITRDLYFCSGARSAWSRGSGNKPSQAERQVSVFISWHFLHPCTSLFHSCSCFLGPKLKLEVTDSKEVKQLVYGKRHI